MPEVTGPDSTSKHLFRIVPKLSGILWFRQQPLLCVVLDDPVLSRTAAAGSVEFYRSRRRVEVSVRGDHFCSRDAFLEFNLEQMSMPNERASFRTPVDEHLREGNFGIDQLLRWEFLSKLAHSLHRRWSPLLESQLIDGDT